MKCFSALLVVLSAQYALFAESDRVNCFIGTGGDGHCFPAAAYPFGLVQAGPDTGWGTWDYCSGYRYEDSHITMFSQTHNPGGGCPDYADIGLMPGVVSNRFSHADETARPGYYAVTLKDGNIRVETTASEHCAFYRINYGKRPEAKLLVDLDHGISNPTWAKKTVQPLDVDRSPADGLTGHLLRSGFVKGRHIGFDIRFSKRPVGCEELPPLVREQGVKFRSPRLVYTFDLSDGAPLLVKCALSAVDGEGAGRNLRQEIPAWDFDGVRAAAEAKWRQQLSRVELDPATDADIATQFATGVYRLFHTPSNIADVDGRYRGGDGEVRVAPNGRYYSEFSLWDTFRGAHPFYTIVAPEYVPDFVNSLVLHGEAAGFLPVLPKWGRDSQCMIATHAVAVIAEAYFKGFKGVDWERAYRAIRQTLRETHPSREKEGWDVLDKYGYYPCDVLKGEGVSRTLECSYDDWCAARMAAALGHAEDAAFFAKRAENWRNVFDAKTGFMRGRKTDGTWREPFDPYHCGHESSWAGDFTEGNAWQWRWHVLQDPSALIAALGGKERAAALLDELFTLPSSLDKTQTSRDVTGLLGQYVQGNEPSHHIPYLYQYAGRPDRTTERIRELTRKFYRNAPDGLCGNEDHGEMSAWYVFACLGFYPVSPASGEFVLGAPQVPGATLRLADGKTFRIVAEGFSEENALVESVSLNGRPLDGFVLKFTDIAQGGELKFRMRAATRNVPTNRPPFLVSTACKWPIFGDSGWRRANLEAAAREFPEWKWIYGEPNTIDKMLRLGFNSVNLFALPAERFKEPRTLDCFLRQMKVVAGKGVPFYLDLHTGRSTVPGRVRAAMSEDLDVKSLFHAKAGSTFGIPFRLTDEKAVEAYVRMYVHDAKTYKEMGLKPWAYKLLNEATYGDKACDLEERERLTTDVVRRLHDALREVEPDMPCFVQMHNRSWRSNWNGMDLYSMTRPLEIISIGTGGFSYSEGDRAPAGTRFAEAEEPGDAVLDDLGAIAFYRALAHGKPIVASELYFPGTGNRSRELEATLWHAAAEGISMVNLWEWGSIKIKPSSASYALYNPHSCAPETWTGFPRMVAEIESLSDFFPVGARRETTRVAVLFSNPTRRRKPKMTMEFCRAVSALELAHIRTDAIFEEQLVPGEDCRIGDYDVILVAGATDFLPTTQSALAAWQQRGGTLVKVDTSLPLYRMAVGLKERVVAKGIRPIAEVRDVETGDEAPSVRVFKAKSGGLTGWMLANYSDTARLVTVAADELRGGDCAAIQPFGTNAWPLADGRMTVLVPERFHALAVTGPQAELVRRFGRKEPVSSAALASTRDRLIAESAARAPRRESVPVDLKPFVNGAFDNQQGWSIPIAWADGCGLDLKGVPYHAQTYRHIVFDVIRFDYNGNRTTLAMRSQKRPDGLDRTPDIGLGSRPLRGIAVLGAITHARPGETAATLEVSYVDGTKERFPLRTGIELGSWKVADNAEGKRDDCVWKNRDGFGLFVCEWENPRPSDPVSHFNLVGGSGESAANVVAVSALPSRFGTRYRRRIDLAEGLLSLPKGKTERLAVKPEDVSADGVLRLEIAHPRGRFGSSAKFSRVGAYLVGRTAAGERVSTEPHERTSVCGAFGRQVKASVASADEWAEIEIPLAMMTTGMGSDGRLVEMVSIEEVVLNEQSAGDHLYRKVRIECGEPLAKVRVGTYNIRTSGWGWKGDRGTPNDWEKRKGDLVALIKRLDMDVFGMQEVCPDQADYFRCELGAWVFLGDHRGADRKSDEASPICYRRDRFEALKSGTFWLSETPDEAGSKSWESAHPRVCSYAILRDRTSGRRFAFANTHTDHKSELARKNGMTLIIERMKAFGGADVPVVFVGDHNCSEIEAPAQAVSKLLKNAYEISETPPKGPWRTWNGWRWKDEEILMPEALAIPADVRNIPSSGMQAAFSAGESGSASPAQKFFVRCSGPRIDYIWVSDGVRVLDYETVAQARPGSALYPSDHFPVRATIEIGTTDHDRME